MKEAGIAHKFFAFTENVLRENILEKADHITPSFDEFLYVNDMPSALSYPKNRIKVLLLDGVDEHAADAFRGEGYEVVMAPKKLSKSKLRKLIKDVSILGVPAHQVVTGELLDHASRLMAIGIFGGSTNHIDLIAAADRGVIVFNAPYANTRSLVEMVIGNIIILSRNIPYLSSQLKAGKWQTSKRPSYEIRGKKLGIIGYGNSGTQLSVLAESLGMDVYYYDVFEKQAIGNATKCNALRDLLRRVDIVSIHVDNRPENAKFFGKREFKAMRDGAIFLNLSSGQAVDMDELYKNLKSKKIVGAGIDVFPNEPIDGQGEFTSRLMELDNVLLTPHIGGQTLEAQENTAEVLPVQIIDYVNTGSTFNGANFPALQLPILKNAHRLIHIHQNQPGILARINSTLADHGINIIGQYLQTTESIGYVITDINKKYSQEVLKDLKEIEATIKFRVLF
jgi:D-3-phosphoglycerate dehydrogenase